MEWCEAALILRGSRELRHAVAERPVFAAGFQQVDEHVLATQGRKVGGELAVARLAALLVQRLSEEMAA